VHPPTLCARHVWRLHTLEQHWLASVQRFPTCLQPKWVAPTGGTASAAAATAAALPTTPVRSRRREDAATARERVQASKRSASKGDVLSDRKRRWRLNAQDGVFTRVGWHLGCPQHRPISDVVNPSGQREPSDALCELVPRRGRPRTTTQSAGPLVCEGPAHSPALDRRIKPARLSRRSVNASAVVTAGQPRIAGVAAAAEFRQTAARVAGVKGGALELDAGVVRGTATSAFHATAVAAAVETAKGPRHACLREPW
jgi:hypothetical protein